MIPLDRFSPRTARHRRIISVLLETCRVAALGLRERLSKARPCSALWVPVDLSVQALTVALRRRDDIGSGCGNEARWPIRDLVPDVNVPEFEPGGSTLVRLRRRGPANTRTTIKPSSMRYRRLGRRHRRAARRHPHRGSAWCHTGKPRRRGHPERPVRFDGPVTMPLPRA